MALHNLSFTGVLPVKKVRQRTFQRKTVCDFGGIDAARFLSGKQIESMRPTNAYAFLFFRWHAFSPESRLV